jgi:TonB family protein
MRSLLMLSLLLCSSFLYGQSRSLAGTFHGEVYECDSLGFSYQLPAGYKPSSIPPQKLPSGSQYLFVADAHTGNPLMDRIVLVADDARGTYLSLHDYVQKMAKSMAVQPQTVLVHAAVEVKLAGKRFYREDLNEYYDGGVMYKTALWTERRDYFLFWFIVAQSPEELEEALHSVDEIKFHDDAADENSISSKTIDAVPGKRIRVPEEVSKSMIRKKGDVGYAPGSARTKVVVRVIVSPGGAVQDVTVLSGNPRLNFRAIRAAEDYQFRPYIWQGHRVEMQTEITLTFEPPPPSAK